MSEKARKGWLMGFVPCNATKEEMVVNYCTGNAMMWLVKAKTAEGWLFFLDELDYEAFVRGELTEEKVMEIGLIFKEEN